jgi:ATP/maltotriose-dependent transcriptional regulator MalT
MVWVCGPPGAGKTALAASYVTEGKLGGAWYQVDADDRIPATLFHYMSQAVRAPRRAAALPMLGLEHESDLHGFARVYFRALFAQLRPPAVLVFDNCHELPPDSELHALLPVLVREVPENVTVLVTSRGDPPATCAALRATGTLVVIGWDELRLTREETRAESLLRLELDEEMLNAVHARSDGWAVGLTLTLEQFRRGDTPGASGTLGREVLFDYFAGQIFADMTDARRRVLTRCALLPSITAEQACQLCDDTNAATELEELYRRRLFVDRRGDA